MKSAIRRFALLFSVSACLCGVFAGGALAAGPSIDVINCNAAGCTGSWVSQGFQASTFIGSGRLEAGICFYNSQPCENGSGVLVFDPGLILAGGSLGSTSGGVIITPTFIGLGSTLTGSVVLTASNGAVGVVTIPDRGAACVNFNNLTITQTACP